MTGVSGKIRGEAARLFESREDGRSILCRVLLQPSNELARLPQQKRYLEGNDRRG